MKIFNPPQKRHIKINYFKREFFNPPQKEYTIFSSPLKQVFEIFRPPSTVDHPPTAGLKKTNPLSICCLSLQLRWEVSRFFFLYIPQETKVSIKNVLRMFEAHFWKKCKNVEPLWKNSPFLYKKRVLLK